MTADTNSAHTVRWGCAGRSYGDAETLDQALGTAVTVDDSATTTANQVLISAATSAITLGGTPAAGEWVRFRIYRDPANDDINVDCRLLELRITYTST
jgi:hypothetical protein